MKVTEFLDQRNVRFETMKHPAAYSGLKLAEEVHVSGRQVAKTVLLRADGGYVIAILPTTHCIDFESLEVLLGTKPIELATEMEAMELFPDMESGVVPMFGSVYGIRTIVDIHLAGCESIVFEGTTHEEAIRIAYEDFERIENPVTGLFTTKLS
jgi:Ala-tRNA(Pro) deacylase